MKIYKTSSETITLYQGQSVHNKSSKYYSTDKEWARQFTQSGQDHEIKTITINRSNIYVKDPLPHATSDDEFDQALAEAKEQGFNALMLDEGVNKPNSVYIFGEIAKPMSQLDYQKRYDRWQRTAVKPRYFGVQDVTYGNPHDYDPSWDYEEDLRPKRKMMKASIQAAKDIEAKHMQEFSGCFSRFRISFVTNARGGLAQFANGTGREPVVLIDLRACAKIQQELKNDFTMYQVAITTLMHELKHAKQETEGRDAEMSHEQLEDDAEELGMRYM